ncbi:MAG: cell division protein FtsL [Firmicutes bacterium]|nr:cell division protein FtsL [Bacillota bacterium]
MAKKKGQISTFETKEPKNKKITRSGIIMIAVLVIAAAYFVVSGFKIIQLNQELDEAEKAHQQLLNTKEDLLAEYEHVSSPQYIERVARRDLKLVRGNELLFIMPETDMEKIGPRYEGAASEEGKDETEDGKTED